jgi:hypothetical protein
MGNTQEVLVVLVTGPAADSPLFLRRPPSQAGIERGQVKRLKHCTKFSRLGVAVSQPSSAINAPHLPPILVSLPSTPPEPLGGRLSLHFLQSSSEGLVFLESIGRRPVRALFGLLCAPTISSAYNCNKATLFGAFNPFLITAVCEALDGELPLSLVPASCLSTRQFHLVRTLRAFFVPIPIIGKVRSPNPVIACRESSFTSYSTERSIPSRRLRLAVPPNFLTGLAILPDSLFGTDAI